MLLDNTPSIRLKIPLLLQHLGAKPACSHVACCLGGDADLCSLRHLPRGLCGRSSGLPPRVVYKGDPQTSGRGEEHPGAEGGEEAAGASRHGQHAGAQLERETGVYT